MKKLLSKACLLAVLSAILLTATAAAAEIGTGVITGNSVRMRSEASTSSAVVTHLDKGDSVQVNEKLDGWYKVTVNGNAGYVSSDYVSYTPAARDLSGKTGVINGSDVNFRSGPSTGDGVITKLNDGAQLSLAELSNGWCKATYNGSVGYVSADYVLVDGIPLADPRGVVTGSSVNVRSGPSTGDGVVTQLNAGTVVELISLNNNWYKISYEGVSGYISGDYVKLYDGSSDGAAAGSSLGQSVVAKAKQYLGTRYSYGGASPSGFDCSGFTMYIYKQFGYSLPHSASSQWNSVGTYVDRANLQPGDLVLFNDPSRSGGKPCSHVGIYVGNGQFIHASSGSGRGVVISSLSDSYYSRYYKGAKRVA